jgi:hypothetical protein
MTQTFDISLLDDTTAAPLTARVAVIVNADGEDQSGFVILSKDSPEFQAVQAELRIEGLKKSAKRGSQIDASTDAGAETLSRLISANETRLALSVVTDIFGFSNNGEPVPFSKELVAKMFLKFPTWQQKVMASLEVAANFTKG